MAILLPSTPILAAIVTPLVGPVLNIEPGPLRDLALLGKLIVPAGASGVTLDAYIQTSFNSGLDWMDIRNFHWTTTSAQKLVNHSSGLSVTTAATPGDGALASDTSVDGFIGSMLRVKYKSSGTYPAGTLLSLFAGGGGVRS